MSKYQKQGFKWRTQEVYSLAFKLQIVSEIEKGDLNKNQAKFKHGIQGCSTILNWLRRYSTLDWKTSSENAMSKKPLTPEQRI
ncbi:MAG: hypothetical protein HXX13_11940 [Bacteroidetes bacterium]|nr:hypothetical protein [Bacteroidota bacterium]